MNGLDFSRPEPAIRCCSARPGSPPAFVQSGLPWAAEDSTCARYSSPATGPPGCSRLCSRLLQAVLQASQTSSSSIHSVTTALIQLRLKSHSFQPRPLALLSSSVANTLLSLTRTALSESKVLEVFAEYQQQTDRGPRPRPGQRPGLPGRPAQQVISRRGCRRSRPDFESTVTASRPNQGQLAVRCLRSFAASRRHCVAFVSSFIGSFYIYFGAATWWCRTGGPPGPAPEHVTTRRRDAAIFAFSNHRRRWW